MSSVPNRGGLHMFWAVRKAALTRATVVRWRNRAETAGIQKWAAMSLRTCRASKRRILRKFYETTMLALWPENRHQIYSRHMSHNNNRKPRKVTKEMAPERAFVVQFHEPAGTGSLWGAGRVEHVMSGESGDFGTAQELTSFSRAY